MNITKLMALHLVLSDPRIDSIHRIENVKLQKADNYRQYYSQSFKIKTYNRFGEMGLISIVCTRNAGTKFFNTHVTFTHPSGFDRRLPVDKCDGYPRGAHNNGYLDDSVGAFWEGVIRSLSNFLEWFRGSQTIESTVLSLLDDDFIKEDLLDMSRIYSKEIARSVLSALGDDSPAHGFFALEPKDKTYKSEWCLALNSQDVINMQLRQDIDHDRTHTLWSKSYGMTGFGIELLNSKYI